MLEVEGIEPSGRDLGGQDRNHATPSDSTAAHRNEPPYSVTLERSYP